ncbi:MAG: hypothetical protein JJ850_13685 [Kordiimonadaceae bacterium]|nr:hypothetical protein [Kordiimonadaceae bacterium]MBO6570237.1 hypothetical protein [Kordiimonadaceae bacterium]MBO6965665.1 hypothetical protein [Kordiimonadaceae bacterium]
MTELPEAAEEEIQSKGKMTPTAYMSMLALAFSFLALLVSLYEALAVRAEQKADVWPYISISQRYNEDGYAIVVANKGVGPARIQNLQVTFNGQQFKELDNVILATLGKEKAFSYELYRTSVIDSGVMSADEEAVFFSVPWEPRTQQLAESWEQGLDVSICYCSIYEDCWQASNRTTEPREINACRAR